MKGIWKMALATALVIAPAGAKAAKGPDKEAAEAVGLAAQQIEEDYVDAALARTIAARMRKEAQALRRGGKRGDALAEELTQLLRTLSSDAHFRFGYSEEAMPENVFAPKPGGEAGAAARTARINNFGVLKAERLPGNIGLLDLDQFTDPALMRAPLGAAMELLKNCDALIVDLRYNGGGHARAAALAVSYFLPEAPQRLLVRLQTRDPEEALEIRTFSTLEGPRFLDKPVYLLTGAKTFSAAEMFAASLQQAGRVKVVGSKTRGGGNPVARVRLTPHYGLLLPTSRSVVPGGKSWEGVGVAPDLAAEEKEALPAARRAALAALLAQRPDDMLAQNWRTLLAELSPSPPAAPQPASEGAQ